ncbi:MAG: M36 family metallopeptidase, partial [Ignavibacteria bacterium]|nr:M36 family metallopeptidase [Ignavibacteria bacterium]
MNGHFIKFDPSNDEEEQQILNIFYFCNYMHDFFYLLGFDESAGSFEGEDPVIARAHNAAIYGTANMSTPIDGSSPIMNMGILTNSGRHTALDADVVFHEYVHGITNRLVGGRVNDRALQEDQSRALGEGWSDYFALSIQNFSNESEKRVTGSWVKNSQAGIRSHPYYDNYDQHLTYGRIGQVNGEHRRGELWCAALMHWTRHLSSTVGKEQAYCICWQSIVDGLKLTNANPSFLNARDGILLALNALRDSGKISEAHFFDAKKQFLGFVCQIR